MPTMPFGRFKGVLLTDIPASYVIWLLTRQDLPDPLRTALLAEAQRRGLVGRAPVLIPPRALDVIDTGFKHLAVRHHPDHGGDHAAMVELVAARDYLRALVGA